MTKHSNEVRKNLAERTKVFSTHTSKLHSNYHLTTLIRSRKNFHELHQRIMLFKWVDLFHINKVLLLSPFLIWCIYTQVLDHPFENINNLQYFNYIFFHLSGIQSKLWLFTANDKHPGHLNQLKKKTTFFSWSDFPQMPNFISILHL